MNSPTAFLILFFLIPGSFDAGAQESKKAPLWPILKAAAQRSALPNTALLKADVDFADMTVSGADAFVLKKIEASRDSRKPTAKELAEILGLTLDARITDPKIEYIDTLSGPRAEADSFRVFRVRWRAFRDVYGYGLLLEPKGNTVRATVVAIPDADQEPEQIAGLGDLPENFRPFACDLAANGCRVLVPSLISRAENQYAMTMREYLHRSAYELGRTLIGYELQKVLSGTLAIRENAVPCGVVGWGEGGRLALYAGAVDQDFSAVWISGYFGPREAVWNEPADRTVFGLLKNFGDAEIASLIGPEKLVLEFSHYPEFVFRPDENGEPEMVDNKYTGKRGKPGRLITPDSKEFASEVRRIPNREKIAVIQSDQTMNQESLGAFLERLAGVTAVSAPAPSYLKTVPSGPTDASRRQAGEVEEIDQHNQWAVIDSRRVRSDFFADLNTRSDIRAYRKSVEPYRRIFSEQIIGHFDQKRLPLNPRTRKFQEGEGVVSYRVLLDTFPGMPLYGILTMPQNMPLDGSKKLPVIVCQHGLEGRPEDVIGEAKYRAYKAFATRLAQRDYITFAPQNLYILFDRFRSLQFKANSLGKTLFSFLVPQHEQLTSWLAEQPWVESDKIAFYGLSYGGKSAMRIPALVERYCLSICSGDFNEWIWKNAATDAKSLRYSYANKAEYEIFEFNLGNTFNYAEMAALICPRPFMVERGHFDGVAPDEAVAYEYAKVRKLYAAELHIPERTTIEWFPGPHTIHGVATFQFLDRHLKK